MMIPIELNKFVTDSGGAARVFRSPGRLNIIGEHSDYNDGLVMPFNIALSTWVAIIPRSDRRVCVQSLNVGETTEIDLDEIHRDPAGGWTEYLKGVLCVLQQHGYGLIGADVLITSEIPIGGGLSSSASLETAMAMAMLSIGGLPIDRKKIAWMCKEAENDFVGVACGIMDQYVTALSKHGQAMMLDCRSMDFEQIAMPSNARLLIVNSGVTHALNDGEFNLRQQECQQTVCELKNRGLEIKALRDVSIETLRSEAKALGDVLYRRARHVVSEIQRVRDAQKAMSESDLPKLGELINASHASLKDDFEVSCTELDDLVGIARDCRGVYGSRMVGAGFGGCTISLVDDQFTDAVIEEISEEYGAVLGETPWCYAVDPGDAVNEVFFK